MMNPAPRVAETRLFMTRFETEMRGTFLRVSADRRKGTGPPEGVNLRDGPLCASSEALGTAVRTERPGAWRQTGPRVA